MSYNYCAIQQNAVVSSSSRGNMGDCRSSVICPKPRRVGRLSSATAADPYRPPRWHLGHQSEVFDARAGSELLDLILSKGGQVAERLNTQVASSPPFFCGSPPGRVSNPIIQDARFREEKQLVPPFSPLLPSPIPATPGSAASSPNSSARKGGCVRASFGNNPAVRVEGFDCLENDCRNRGILALA